VTERAIIHVDMDAFYASVEQRERPELRGKDLIIAGLGRRGVVLTASYEARRYGVRSAMPTAEAKRLCPDGIYIEPRMDLYAEVSAQVFAAFEEVTPEVEGLSLDEAFLDVTASQRLLGDIEAIGRRIKQGVRDRTRLTCSVGMAHNKLLAKLASELGKPDGFLHITPDRVRATLDPLPVSRLWTVGKVAGAKLEQENLRTFQDLRTCDERRLTKLFGSHGPELKRLASGIDDRPVCAEREEKSIGAETTFEYDVETLDEARAVLMRLTERMAERVRAQEMAGVTVTVKLRVPPFETMTRQCTLPEPTDATAAIYAAGERLLEHWWNERRRPKLRLLGITLSGFDREPTPQRDLFAQPPAGPADELLDRINRRFGKGAIRHATGLK
jgi:DNA polymerase-4